jgi:hypothetical protein
MTVDERIERWVPFTDEQIEALRPGDRVIVNYYVTFPGENSTPADKFLECVFNKIEDEMAGYVDLVDITPPWKGSRCSDRRRVGYFTIEREAIHELTDYDS